MAISLKLISSRAAPYWALIWSVLTRLLIGATGGSYVLTARATDNNGDNTVSSPINITVTGGTGNNDNFANVQPLSGQSGAV